MSSVNAPASVLIALWEHIKECVIKWETCILLCAEYNEAY